MLKEKEKGQSKSNLYVYGITMTEEWNRRAGQDGSMNKQVSKAKSWDWKSTFQVIDEHVDLHL